MKKRWVILLVVFCLGAALFFLCNGSDPVVQNQKTSPSPPPPRAAPFGTIIQPSATASPSATPDAAKSPAQTYFDAHIDRLKRIAYIDYPPAVAKAKAMKPRLDAIVQFGKDYQRRFKDEHDKIDKELGRRLGNFTEDDPHTVPLLVLGSVTFWTDVLHDQTTVVEDLSVGDMLRALESDPHVFSIMQKILANSEQFFFQDAEAMRRVGDFQTPQELLAYLPEAEERFHAKQSELERAAPLSAEEKQFLKEMLQARMMPDVAKWYAGWEERDVWTLKKDFDGATGDLRSLLDQSPEDTPEKRAMLTELSDLYAQMNKLSTGN